MTFTLTGTTKTAAEISAEAAAATLAQLTASIDAHVEAQAQALGYNSAAHIAGYATSTVAAWATEAQAFVQWRDAVWTTAYGLQAQHESAGTVPTEAEVLAALPVWGS